MEKEQFDPHNYKSHEELPEDKKGEFKKVEGGFVRKETVDYERYLKGWAENLNKQRNILSKIFRENKKSTESNSPIRNGYSSCWKIQSISILPESKP